MHPRFAAFMLAWHERCGRPDGGLVFPNKHGRRYAKRGTTFAAYLRRALRLAGVTRRELFEPTDRTLPADDHSIRRLYVTRLAEAGANIQQAMALTGHSSPEVHAVYIRATPEMRTLPAAAIDTFADRALPAESSQPEQIDEGANLETPTISARHAGFEPATSGSGGRRSIQLS